MILAGEPGVGVVAIVFFVPFVRRVAVELGRKQGFEKCGDRGKNKAARQQQSQWIENSPKLPIYQCSEGLEEPDGTEGEV